MFVPWNPSFFLIYPIEFPYVLSWWYIIYTVTTFKHVEGGRQGPGGSMKYQFLYLNVVAVCLNELDSVCLNGWAGQGKPSRR